MTPFIIWLKKEEIDELITFIIRSDSSDKLKHENLDSTQMEDLYEKLLLQNDKLLKLFRKIEPLNPIQKKAAHIYGIKEKCNHYKEHLANMKTHCSIYGHLPIKSSKEYNQVACNDCPINAIIKNTIT